MDKFCSEIGNGLLLGCAVIFVCMYTIVEMFSLGKFLFSSRDYTALLAFDPTREPLNHDSGMLVVVK